MAGLVINLDHYKRARIGVETGEDGVVVVYLGPELTEADEPIKGSDEAERLLSPDDALALAAALRHHAREALR